MQRSVETNALGNTGAAREWGEAKVSDVGLAKVIFRGRQRECSVGVW